MPLVNLLAHPANHVWCEPLVQCYRRTPLLTHELLPCRQCSQHSGNCHCACVSKRLRRQKAEAHPSRHKISQYSSNVFCTDALCCLNAVSVKSCSWKGVPSLFPCLVKKLYRVTRALHNSCAMHSFAGVLGNSMLKEGCETVVCCGPRIWMTSLADQKQPTPMRSSRPLSFSESVVLLTGRF